LCKHEVNKWDEETHTMRCVECDEATAAIKLADNFNENSNG
jgi:hypothetical protein